LLHRLLSLDLQKMHSPALTRHRLTSIPLKYVIRALHAISAASNALHEVVQKPGQ
jgi:hypothetical protein